MFYQYSKLIPQFTTVNELKTKLSEVKGILEMVQLPRKPKRTTDTDLEYNTTIPFLTLR